MVSFASDNNSSVHPEVMEALISCNSGHAFGYGDDPWTEEATRAILSAFPGAKEALMVFNGTGSNTMALTMMTRPYQIVFSATTAHISVDECGAPAKATGCTMREIETPDGKLTPELLEPYMINFGIEHHSQPGAVYISQCTELGTTYTPEEVRALTDFAHRHGMRVHMDGARLSNAAVYLGLSLDEVSGACGIDTLTLGGTKNGLMGAEAVVIFDETLVPEARYFRKQACQLASKMRYVSAQMTAFLTGDLWRRNAEHANRMARKLYDGLRELPEVRFAYKPEGNQLFFLMPRSWEKALEEQYHFYYWDEPKGLMRLVTSWDTEEADVERLLQVIRNAD